MTSTGPQRSFCLLCAMILAGVIAFVPGCDGGESEQNNPSGESSTTGSDQSADSNGETASNGGGAMQDPADVDSEPLRVVLTFQDAVLDLDFDRAAAMVDETTDAHASVITAAATIEMLESRPDIPDAERALALSVARGGWVGATAEEVANEGGSAIIAITRSNGEVVDVNLNYFEDQWLIVSPDDLIQLR